MNYLEESIKLLKIEGINSNSNVCYQINEKEHTFTIEEIINAYMQASVEAQEVFYKTLEKAIDEDKVKGFFEKMGELLLRSSFAENFPQ